MKNPLFFLLILLLSSCSLTSDKEWTVGKKRILIFYQIERYTQPEQVFQEAMREVYGDTSRYELVFRECDLRPFQRYPLKEYFHSTVPSINRRLNEFKGQPDLIFIQSEDISHSAAMCEHPKLTRCPVVCTGVTFPGFNDSLIYKRKNFVVFEQKPEIKKNIDFIQQVNPQSWLIVPLDSTYIDDPLREQIIKELGDDTLHYATNLNFETVRRYVAPNHRDSTRVTLIPLSFEFPYTETCPDDERATLFGALHGKISFVNFLRIKEDCYSDQSLRYNLGLYFSLTPNYFNIHLNTALNSCVGGYFTPWPEMMHQTKGVVDELLLGRNPNTFGPQQFQPDYWLDWRLAKQIHPFAEDFPAGTRFVNMPWYEESRFAYKLKEKWIPWTVSTIAFLLIAIPLGITIANYRQRQRLINRGKKSNEEERQIKAMMLSINAVHWELRSDNRIYMPESMSQLIGLQHNIVPLEEMLQRIDMPERDELRKIMTSSDRSNTQMEVGMLMADGNSHSVIVYINFMGEDNQGVICNGLAVSNDQAHKAKLEREEAFRRAEEADVKESFLASMSHEIRTPVNAIVGFSEVLVKQHALLTKEERKTFEQYIKDSNDHLVQLLDNILQYSDEKGKEFAIKLTTKDVAAMMEDIYNIHTVIVPKHLKLIYKPGPDAKMLANRASLLQVMSNIINNAIKFTEQGSITIGWEIESRDSGNRVVLFVEDTGIGISPENQQSIFKKYYKSTSTSAGAGIGLSLCKFLVEKMNGEISVKSTLGKGSRFEVRLNAD